jgi:hypothetical protein
MTVAKANVVAIPTNPSKKDRSTDLNGAEVEYLQSMINPFAEAAARIPNIYPIPTSIYRVQGSVSMTIGSAGFGYVILKPWQMGGTLYGNGGYANDNAFLTDAGDGTGIVNTAANPVINILDLLITNKVATTTYYSSAGTNPINRFRVVSAGIKVTNTSSISTRAGFITSGHSLEPEAQMRSTDYRNLPTSKTTNSDHEHYAVYVPHDPRCFNFYGFRAVYNTDTSWTNVSSNQNFTVATDCDSAPMDITENYCYAVISGAPNNSFAIEYVINLEYVPNPAYLQTSNPIITARGSAERAVEALVTAPPSSSIWDKVGDSLAAVGSRAVDFLGGMAARYIDKLLPF